MVFFGRDVLRARAPRARPAVRRQAARVRLGRPRRRGRRPGRRSWRSSTRTIPTRRRGRASSAAARTRTTADVTAPMRPRARRRSPFREAFARIRAEFDVPARVPGRGRRRSRRRSAARARCRPACATPARRRARRPVRDDRPGRQPRPRPGVPRRAAARRRLPRALRDRRRRRVRRSRRRARPRGVRRGVTLYLPDGRAPMLPERARRGRGQPARRCRTGPRCSGRSTSTTDGEATGGAGSNARPCAAAPRSTTPTCRPQLDAARADEPLALLREIGTLRRALEAARGGISLDLPTQEVVPDRRRRRTRSSTTRRCRSRGGTRRSRCSPGWKRRSSWSRPASGFLRTLPPPQTRQDSTGCVAAARGSARRLARRRCRGRTSCAASTDDPARRRVPDPGGPRAARRRLCRLDATNTADAAAVPVHAGVAAPYAHVTAPLRRLADRYANEIVLAALRRPCSHRHGPSTVLDELVDAMQAATRRERAVDRAVVDAGRVRACSRRMSASGSRLSSSTATTTAPSSSCTAPAVVAAIRADAALGERIAVRLESVDVVARRLQLAPA